MSKIEMEFRKKSDLWGRMGDTKQGKEGKCCQSQTDSDLIPKVTSQLVISGKLLNLTQVLSLSVKGDNHTYLRELLRGLQEIMTYLVPSRNSIVQRPLADPLSLWHNGSSPTFFLKLKLFQVGFCFSLSALSCMNRNDQRERAPSSSASRWELVSSSLFSHPALNISSHSLPGGGGGGDATTGVSMYSFNTASSAQRLSLNQSFTQHNSANLCSQQNYPI